MTGSIWKSALLENESPIHEQHSYATSQRDQAHHFVELEEKTE